MPGMANAYGLVIGIANYRSIRPLPPSVLQDAQGVYDVLIDPAYCGYDPNHVQLLRDEQATGQNIRQALANLAARSNADSNVLLYLSCHGGHIASGPHTGVYILPVDVDYASDQTIAGTAISGYEFTTALRAIPARKVTVLFDCCHSGGIGQPKDPNAPLIKAGLPEPYYDTLKQGRGRVIIASSRSDEYSWVLPDAINSVFTGHLLAGLRGGAPSHDGVIRVFDLFHYVQPRVTNDHPNQHPLFKAEVEENYALALHLGGAKVAAPTSTGAGAAAPTLDLYELNRTLNDRCSTSDIKDLCLALGIDDENYAHAKADFIRELLRDLQRWGRVDEFVQAIRTEKPWVLR
jgi:hypothetical protein